MGQKRTLEDFIKLANGTHNYVLVFFCFVKFYSYICARFKSELDRIK